MIRVPLPDDVDGRELDYGVRKELLTLTKDTAELVGKHLVMAGRLIDDEPEQALAHARAARALAGRVGAVREANGLVAYSAGEWAEALTELRTARRITGDPEHLAVMADCERALGRPDRALMVAEDPQVPRLSPAAKLELLIVTSGARRDLGQAGAAVVSLQVAALEGPVRPWTARLRYAYADALLDAGRTDEARLWFEKTAEADEDGSTDAVDRLLELDGVVLDDLQADSDDSDGTDDGSDGRDGVADGDTGQAADDGRDAAALQELAQQAVLAANVAVLTGTAQAGSTVVGVAQAGSTVVGVAQAGSTVVGVAQARSAVEGDRDVSGDAGHGDVESDGLEPVGQTPSGTSAASAEQSGPAFAEPVRMSDTSMFRSEPVAVDPTVWGSAPPAGQASPVRAGLVGVGPAFVEPPSVGDDQDDQDDELIDGVDGVDGVDEVDDEVWLPPEDPTAALQDDPDAEPDLRLFD